MLLLEQQDAAPPFDRQSFFLNGQTAGHILALGAAIGAFWHFDATAHIPAQPTPQAAQWEYNSRNHLLGGSARIYGIDPGLIAQVVEARPVSFFAAPAQDATRIQPRFDKQQPAPVVVQDQPIHSWFVYQELRTFVVQPLYWNQQADLIPGPEGPEFVFPPQVIPHLQPSFFKSILESVAVQSPPNRPTQLIRAQDDPTVIQPRFDKQQPAEAAQAVLRQFLLSQQQDASVVQPRIWQTFVAGLEPTPLRPAQFLSQQEDTTRIQPWFDQQAPAPVVPDDTPPRPFFAYPQADPTVVQARFWPIAEIPSAPAVVVPDVTPGWPMYYGRMPKKKRPVEAETVEQALTNLTETKTRIEQKRELRRQERRSAYVTEQIRAILDEQDRLKMGIAALRLQLEAAGMEEEEILLILALAS